MLSSPYAKATALTVGILVIVGGATVWWLYNRGDVTLQEVGLQGASAILQYDVSNPRLVNLLWNEIRGNGNTINVYRSRDNQTWELWKTVAVTGEDGALSFEVGEGESARDYRYYVEIVTGSGQAVVILPPSELAPPSPDSGQPATSTPTSTPSGGGSTSTPETPGQNPTTPPVTPPATTTPPAAATSTPPGTTGQGSAPYTSYYTPSGQLSGTSSIPLITDAFWVRHYGGNVELGWQNLPSGTESVWISRSTSSSGPWLRILNHDNVEGVNTGSIQFNNSAIHEDHYYLLEAIGTNSTTTLGPIFLEGLP